MEDLSLLVSMAIVLGIALIAGLIAHRLKMPAILGYLLAGIVIGPHGVGLIPDTGEVETMATIGVVLLMFSLGIEFSLKTLRQIGRVAIFGGLAQIVATVALGLAIGKLFNWSLMEAALFGLFISLSSTTIVLKMLLERGELRSPHGRVMLGILLVQDLSVVPMMIILPSLGESGTIIGTFGLAVLEAVVFMGVAVILGLWMLPWFMKRVMAVRSRELFLLAIVCICLGVAFGAYSVGLSIALGAFLAGLLVSESDYAHQALADIKPLRDVFATLFFVSLGMLADPRFLVDNPAEVAAIVTAIVVGKSIITALAPLIFGYSIKTSLFVGSGLFQIGEFSFVLAALAIEIGLISDRLYSLTLTSAVITILLTPFAMESASRFYHRIIRNKKVAGFFATRLDPGTEKDRRRLANHVVICGYGATASNLGHVLELRGFSYLAIDIDPAVISAARKKSIPCIYGDASNPEILAHADLERARVMVVTFPDPIATKLAVENARRINRRLDVVARVQRDEDAKILRSLGVAELVHPEIEAGLEIVRHTMHRFGLTTQEIQYIVNTLREQEIEHERLL